MSEEHLVSSDYCSLSSLALPDFPFPDEAVCSLLFFLIKMHFITVTQLAVLINQGTSAITALLCGKQNGPSRISSAAPIGHVHRNTYFTFKESTLVSLFILYT